MPITKSAKKELKKTIKRTVLNNKIKQDMKIAIKIFDKKIKKEPITQADIAYVCKKIDKAAKRNIIHRKNAARKKSSVMKKANAVVGKSENTKTTKSTKK